MQIYCSICHTCLKQSLHTCQILPNFLMLKLSESTVSVEFQANCLKLCGNSTFPQQFRIRKLHEISVFYAVLLQQSYELVPKSLSLRYITAKLVNKLI